MNGQDPLVANYILDNASPVTKSEVAIDQSTPIGPEVLFESPVVELGPHSLNINVVQTGGDRNYALWYFAIFNTTSESGGGSVSPTSSGTLPSSSATLPQSVTSQTSSLTETPDRRSVAVGAIIGGTVGSFFVVAAILLIWLLRIRRASAKEAEGTLTVVHNLNFFLTQYHRADDISHRQSCFELSVTGYHDSQQLLVPLKYGSI